MTKNELHVASVAKNAAVARLREQSRIAINEMSVKNFDDHKKTSSQMTIDELHQQAQAVAAHIQRLEVSERIIQNGLVALRDKLAQARKQKLQIDQRCETFSSECSDADTRTVRRK